MTIPFGIDKDLFYSRSTRTNPAVRPELICISSAVPVKSHITMFRAIKILKDKYPDVMLKVYGRDDKDKLKRMVHELNLEKNIEIMGFTEYEKIPGVLNEADIFVSSSLYESQNMSLVEAAFCGLPVISTDTGVAREVTENIFKAGDAEQLASKIADVTGRYAQKKQEALNRLPMLHENFSLENVTSRYLELYKNTAGA